MSAAHSIVFLGLSLSSSWGNGHATTYRALIEALAERGHKVSFLERDVPWYAAHRDLRDPSYCRLSLYSDVAELKSRHARMIAEADVVIIGSFVPEGPQVTRFVLDHAGGLVGFYDIDTPVTVSKLEDADEEYLAADLVPEFDFYLSFTSGPILERLETEFGVRLAVPFHCMVDPERYRPTGEAPEWDLGYLGTYSIDRQPALERLLFQTARRLPDKRFVVAGPQYPGGIDWPANVEWIDHVPPDKHPSFYSRLRFALNLTRADMLAAGWSPSVRLFEAAACGTPILTDRWAGLDSFFPEGEAIRTVEGPEDVATVLDGMNQGQAARMASKAREIVLSKHTGRRRAEELERALEIACLEKQSRSTLKENRHALSAPA